MNWANFQTYNDAPTKAFEILCNQLFENWCKEQYTSELASFHVVNGAGGDGGVESYAVLSGGNIIGLQAKWFLDSITDNQMGQIKRSINTALKNRPQITRYIVCVPRDLASLTGKGENTEDKRWENMKSEILKDNPNLVLELWNETRLTQELQKEVSAGIFKYWFERAEISEESIKFSFEKSKKSWLSTKYVPELNALGAIHDFICTYLGDVDQRKELIESFGNMSALCDKFYITSAELIDVCGENDPQLVVLLNETNSQMLTMQREIDIIQSWLKSETIFELSFNEDAFWIDFSGIAAQIKESKEEYSHYFHFSAVIKVLQSLGKIRIQPIMHQVKRTKERRSLVFLGEPGTGKTHGVAAEAERLLNGNHHIPVLIQARDISMTATWKDMLTACLGLSASWSEEEIWQGLSSLANRRRIHALDECDEVSVLPKIMIVVDGVDESSLHDKWIEWVQETAAIVQNYPFIRFVFMSRPYVFRDKNVGVRTINIGVTGDVSPYKLFDSYVKAYNIDASSAAWVKYALTTPLALKLFCELNEGKKISYHSSADTSLAALLKKKIEILEREYCKLDPVSTIADQNIFRAILKLAKSFSCESRFERKAIIDLIAPLLSGDISRARKIVDYLENYGILRVYCEHSSDLLSPDIYYYYPGIQGYFDYASAIILIDEYKVPEKIDFNTCKELPYNSYYILAIISIQKFAYLITSNKSIDSVISEAFKEELLFFALRHTKSCDAEQFKTRLLQLMAKNAELLKTITNKVILPLAREHQHPLGVSLLNEFLQRFEFPAQRDVLWSVPSYLKGSEGEVWYSSSEVDLVRGAYFLTDVDVADGLPTAYAWALATVNNVKRKEYRIELMKWALRKQEEFYKLFLKFSNVNDPQIRSDMFSILMSLLFEGENKDLISVAAKWLTEKVLAPEEIEKNRDIAIRYYSIEIVRKAMSLNIIDEKTALKFLPPFATTTNDIALSKEVLTKAFVGEYGGLSYDLERYVLVDHITGVFPNYGNVTGKQYEKLIASVTADLPEFANMSVKDFIISAAYKFITLCGWSEEFRYHKVDGNTIRGVDWAISGSHRPKTHGTQSPVMTICEKYVWQARNYISGFLADRLMHVNDNDAYYVDDYGLVDGFLIPALEIEEIDPNSNNDLYPWHIPEKDAVIIPGKSKSQDDVIFAVQESPNITWEEWIQIDNVNREYPIEGDKLIALCGYSCFEGEAGVETNLFSNAVLIATNDANSFIKELRENDWLSHRVANPSDWEGGCNVYCYVTPKEMCWMPWKKRYDSSNIYDFPNLAIHSTVEECTCNFVDHGDVCYRLPSAPMREMLKITNTDGCLFYDCDKQIKAASISVGESWWTQQSYLLVNKTILQDLEQNGKTLLWFLRENRRENRKARERFGEFYTEKDCYHLGFFRDGAFVVTRIFPQKGNGEELDETNDPLLDIVVQYGYSSETSDHPRQIAAQEIADSLFG